MKKPAADALTCVVYRRISAAADRLGVERQGTDTEALAAARGWRITEVYEDNDLSASAKAKRERPEFDRLLRDIAAGKVTRLVATEWERIERNRKDCARFMDVAVPAGVLVALVRGADMDLSSPAGRLVADVLSGIARHEVEQKDARAESARRQRLAMGKKAGGSRPFGYTTKMEPHPVEADAVREAYRRVIAGHSIGSIVADFNARGLVSAQAKAGKGWQPGNFSAALRKGVYCGLLEHNGETMDIPGDWEPLVSRADWETAQAILRDPARLAHRGQPKTLLAGQTCGKCGARLVSGADVRRYRLYKCSASNHLAFRQEWADEHVLTKMDELLRLSSSLVRAHSKVMASLPHDLGMTAGAPAKLVDQVEKLEKQRASLAADLGLSEAVLVIRINAIEEKLAELREQIAEAVRVPVQSSTSTLLARHFSDPARAAEEFAGFDTAKQRAVIKDFVKVTLHGAGRGNKTFKPETVTVELHEHLLSSDAKDAA